MKNDVKDANPKDEMVELIMRELTGIKRRVSEIKDQIDSMQSAVEREQNRYSNIATELRSIRENLDTTPREDIRERYDEALEVRFRLATMRGQLEKFESHYENLQQQQSLLQQVVGKIQNIDDLTPQDNGGSGKSAAASGGLDIIGIIRTQEEERERLARAMHDGPAQSLTNFILQAEICQRLFDRNPERAAEELGNLKTNASKTFQKVRDFIFDLRPMMLSDLGIVPTVRRYVESYKDKSDIEVKLNMTGNERRLESYREVMIFRGIQDVMSLARDYANPAALSINLDMSTKIAKISVEDNGRGFDAEKVTNPSPSDEGYSDARVQALQMIKSKFELVGGSLEVRSGETEGTIVRMELPTGE